jgi:hypothetical protein
MQIEEQILIVYSIRGTEESDLNEVEKAVVEFRRQDSSIRVTPKRFKLPDGVNPGTTLASELYKALISSVGAIVFVDDLRANVAYELGFFHGQEKLVLLITRKQVEDIWLTISDLAGATLANVANETIELQVKRYLNRLYDQLAFPNLWDSIILPTKEKNIIKDHADQIDSKYLIDSDFGTGLSISEWHPGVNFNVGRNLLLNATFTIVLRQKKVDSLYTIYFNLIYSDATAEKKDIWIGLTSVNRTANLQSNERLVPSKNASIEWIILSGSFLNLFKHTHVLGKIEILSLISMRIRAGSNIKTDDSEIEIGYISILGLE